MIFSSDFFVFYFTGQHRPWVLTQDISVFKSWKKIPDTFSLLGAC
jgi:hypothetical protein